MIIKLVGMGPKMYISDQFNIFDSFVGKILTKITFFFIVLLSIIDIIVTNSISDNGQSQSKGPITAFRAFRLLRVFKLSKSWGKLKFLLSTIARALRDISSFSVLLFLLIFVYVLLGMELFANRSIEAEITRYSIEEAPRTNFDNFYNGFLVIFTVLTEENWDSTMFFFAKKHGYIAIFFFISLVIIGVWIFLNLFLAILLENFEV